MDQVRSSITIYPSFQKRDTYLGSEYLRITISVKSIAMVVSVPLTKPSLEYLLEVAVSHIIYMRNSIPKICILDSRNTERQGNKKRPRA